MELERMRRLTSMAIVAALAMAGCTGSSPTAAPTTAPTLPATPALQVSVAPSGPSAAPTGSPAPATPSPTSSPTPQAEYSTDLNWANEVAMRVIVSGLNVRTRPSTSAARIGKAPKGSVFLFLDWPTRANGFNWYFGYQATPSADGSLPALPHVLDSGGVEPLSGWVAAGTSDAPYLEPIPARCPTTVDLANVEAMLNSERVACFGSDGLELTGTYGCGGCGGINAGTFTPSWLADPLGFNFLSVDPSARIGPLGLRFAPDGPTGPPDGTIVRVRAHFADARSSTCVIAPLGKGDVPTPIPSGIARDYCRAQLVVDSFNNLGTDPRFPK
jgi:hypothetical protein